MDAAAFHAAPVMIFLASLTLSTVLRDRSPGISGRCNTVLGLTQKQTTMNDSSNLILFLATQFALPLGIACAYCRSKSIPTQSWRAGGIFLIAMSAAMLFFTGLLGLPTYVKNVGFMTNRHMGLTCGAIGIVMGYLARRFESERSD